jgi:hypothetical protein
MQTVSYTALKDSEERAYANLMTDEIQLDIRKVAAAAFSRGDRA